MLQLLANIGVPAAIILFLVIAYLFRENKNISIVAVSLAIFFGIAFAVIQLVPGLCQVFRGGGVVIQTTPTEDSWQGFTREGAPTDVEVNVLAGEEIIATMKVPGAVPQAMANRVLTLARDPSGAGLLVNYREQPIGRISRAALEALGWAPAGEAPATSGFTELWNTSRVILGGGSKIELGQGPQGLIYLRPFQYTADGNAEVSLELAGFASPQPERIIIANKELAMQVFESKYEYLVAVREADFTCDPPWAAFTVIGR